MRLLGRFIPIFLCLVVVAAARPCHAQDWTGKGRLEGHVMDQDGKPIKGALVKVRVPGRPDDGPNAKTDAKGRWAVMGLRGGDWKITIEAPGYLPGETTFGVSEVYRANPLEYKMAPVPAEAPQPEKTGLPPEVAEALKEGNEALAAKRWTDARVAFEKVLPSAPDNAGLLMALARSYSGEGNTDKAVEMLKKITDKDPANWGAWMLMANMLLEKGRLDEGRTDLEKVPEASITDPNIYINVGVLFMNKAKMDEAETYFDKAVKLAPDKFDGYYYRGLSRIALDKKDGARADFRKVIELAPPNASEVKDAKQYLEALK
jgi:Flp pilus assembly protein TadD